MYFKNCINIYMLISCFKSIFNVKLILGTSQSRAERLNV